MKKLFASLFVVLSLLITSCNYQVVDLNFKFTKVHVFETQQCYEINSWRDYEESDQIQVEIAGYGKCLFHSNQVVLIEDKCPFCK